MELYTLDSDFRKHDVIDVFNSLIWTEKYNEAGDVDLNVPSNSQYKSILLEGTFLGISGSREVMIIETILDEEGMLKITGKTLSGFLSQRILRDSWTTDTNNWTIIDTPANIAGVIVDQMCSVTGFMNGSDILPGSAGGYEYIPNLLIGDLATGSPITVAIPYGNVYDGVKQVCDLASLGFSLYPELLFPSGHNIVFTVYEGRDLTTDQSVNSVVIFEPAMDSLTDVKEIRSIAGFKTAAYAWANGITDRAYIGVAYAPGTETIVGFSRRTMMVDASDVNAADYAPEDLTAILDQKARDALANNNYVRMTDGQLVPQKAFVYGTDYSLGDIIELRGNGVTAQKARITEYIRSQDSNGERAYPTLSIVN